MKQMNRTVTINPASMEALMRKFPARAVFAVIGYLATWGGSVYTDLMIHVEDQASEHPSIKAVYTSSDKAYSFTIGAIYRPDLESFTTHS